MRDRHEHGPPEQPLRRGLGLHAHGPGTRGPAHGRHRHEQYRRRHEHPRRAGRVHRQQPHVLRRAGPFPAAHRPGYRHEYRGGGQGRLVQGPRRTAAGWLAHRWGRPAHDGPRRVHRHRRTDAFRRAQGLRPGVARGIPGRRARRRRLYHRHPVMGQGVRRCLRRGARLHGHRRRRHDAAGQLL